MLFFLVAFIKTKEVCRKQTRGFSLLKVLSDLPYNPDWDLSPLSAEEEGEILSLLDQPFYFLDKGGQCFAFESADEKLVLKLFNHAHLFRPKSPLFHLPIPPYFRKKYDTWVEERKERLESLFGSCVIAFEKLRKETGSLYLHLNPTKHLKRSVVIYDKLNIAHTIALDNLTFALQKKGVKAYSYLEELIRNGETEKAKEGLFSLLSIIASRKAKQVKDYDGYISRNFGFAEGEAIEFDIGSFCPVRDFGTPAMYRSEELLEEELDSLESWLQEKNLLLSTFFHENRKKLPI